MKTGNSGNFHRFIKIPINIVNTSLRLTIE